MESSPHLELKEEGLGPGHDKCDEQDDEDGNVLKVSTTVIAKWPALEETRGQGSWGGHKGQYQRRWNGG